MAKKSMKPGGGGRFEQLKEKLGKKPGVTDPAALAAAIGRKKYGAKKMESFAEKGRKQAKTDQGKRHESKPGKKGGK